MSDIVIKLNDKGIKNLLKSAEIAGAVTNVCNNIAANAGDGYEVSAVEGRLRVIGGVKAATPKAYRDNLKNNTLLKAIGK